MLPMGSVGMDTRALLSGLGAVTVLWPSSDPESKPEQLVQGDEPGQPNIAVAELVAPPVATPDTMAAASEVGEEGGVIPLLIEEGQSVFCARVEARTARFPGGPEGAGSRRAGTPVAVASSNHPS